MLTKLDQERLDKATQAASLLPDDLRDSFRSRPARLAKSTTLARATSICRLSVGWAMAFSCTVLSTMTRLNSRGCIQGDGLIQRAQLTRNTHASKVFAQQIVSNTAPIFALVMAT